MEFDDMDCNAISFLFDVISSLDAQENAEVNQLPLQQSQRSLGNRLNLFRRAVPCTGGTAGRSQTSYYHSCREPAEKLWLYNCRITQTGLRQICKVLKLEFRSITTLHLGYCLIAEECVATIAESLPLTNVITLSLSGNRITDAGVVSLCQALETPTCRVTRLSLDHNKITDAGVVSLCQALQTASCKVTELNLGDNKITDAGVVSLCQALQTPTCRVTRLSLDDNKITDAGVVSLCQALQTAICQVCFLNLSGNQITGTCVTILCQTLQMAQCQVTYLDLGGNHLFTDFDKRRLRKLSKRKPHLSLYF